MGSENYPREGPRMINHVRNDLGSMATEEGTESPSPLDAVMADIRRELVRRVAARDRDSHREIYDALETE